VLCKNSLNSIHDYLDKAAADVKAIQTPKK
jgi:hypothetical protein